MQARVWMVCGMHRARVFVHRARSSLHLSNMAATGIGFVSLDSIPRYTNGKNYGVPLTTFVGVEVSSVDIVTDLVYQSCALGDALYDIQYTKDEQGRRLFASGGMGFSARYKRSRPIEPVMVGELKEAVLDAIAKQASPALAYDVYLASKRTMDDSHNTAKTPIEQRERELDKMQQAFGFYLEMCVCAVHWLAFVDLQKQVRASAWQFVSGFQIDTEYCRKYTSTDRHLNEIDTWTGRINEGKRDDFLRFLERGKSVPTRPTVRYFPRGRLMLDLHAPVESAIWATVMLDTGLFIYMTTMDESTDKPTDEHQWEPEEPRLYASVAGHAKMVLSDYEKTLGSSGAMQNGLPECVHDVLEHTRTELRIRLGQDGTSALALTGFTNKRITGVSKVPDSLSVFLPRLLAANAELEPSTSVIHTLEVQGVPSDVGVMIRQYMPSSGFDTRGGAVEVEVPPLAPPLTAWLRTMSRRSGNE